MKLEEWKWKDDVKVKCSFQREHVADLFKGTGSYFKSTEKHWTRSRTTTKNIVEQIRGQKTTIGLEVERSIKAGVSFPVEVVECSLESFLGMKATFEKSFMDSCSTTSAYEMEKESGYEVTTSITYKSNPEISLVVYKETMCFGDKEISRKYLCAAQNDWDSMKRSEKFETTLNVGVEPQWYHIRNELENKYLEGNFDLGLIGSIIPVGTLLMKAKSPTSRQKWRWSNYCLICKDRHEAKLCLTVAGNSSNSREKVFLSVAKAIPEEGQKWKLKDGNFVQNGQGFFLSRRAPQWNNMVGNLFPDGLFVADINMLCSQKWVFEKCD